MTDANEIGWGSYMSWEGPWFKGVAPFVLPSTPTESDRVLAVITSTEGGMFDAGNFYDRMICSVGLLQFGSAAIYAVSDMLGQVARRDLGLLDPLGPALKQAGAGFRRNNKGRYRFFIQGNEVDTLAEQQRLFLHNSTGLKGSWDDESKGYAKLWAASIANLFQQEEAQRAQLDFTASRLMGFATQDAKGTLWESQDPMGFPQGWVGAVRAAYLSFAANLPAVAGRQLQVALTQTTAPKWSPDWCIGILRQLTFGPNITIYPHRYEAIRPVVESLFGVDLPDFASELQAWHATNNIDTTPGPGMPPTFTTSQQVQTELIAEGYDLGSSGADGVDGPKTRMAVMTFQGLHALPTDGIVGPRTRQALSAEFAKRS